MTPSLLCETVTGRTMAELVGARDAATAADMVELRLDGVSDIDVARALRDRRVPAIVTCRPVWEGGKFDGSEEERHDLLSQALARGAEYVDVEWRALSQARGSARFDELIRHHGSRVVVSSHDSAGVPHDLCARARAMRHTGAAVIKVAVTATRLVDTLPLLEVARSGDAVVIGMGDAGVPSRLLASRFGSRWTYGGDGVAPGQVPAARMVDLFRFRSVGAETAIYGVVGDNVMHSLSPAMHNAAFGAAGLNAVYVPLRAADFNDFATFADALGVAGASVTVPFKRDALNASRDPDELARGVGGANTIRRVRQDPPYTPRAAGPFGPAGPWEATNTDVAGFLEPLDALLNDPNVANANVPNGPNNPNDPSDALRAMRVSVLGAGGAARAVIVALLSRGAQVTVHARRRAQGQDLAALFGVKTGQWPPTAASWDLLVNCTPLGSASAPDGSPLPDGPFDGRVVYDLTCRPGESPFLRDARRAGCLTLDGLPMLVAQAERQFEWWTGRRPVRGVMRAAAVAETSHRSTEARRAR